MCDNISITALTD